MCVDLGVNNLAAIQTSNGNSLLVKGEFIKSKNQWFNKQNINIGKVNNQTFAQIPFSLLINYVKDKASKLGIKVIDVEESYTLKASFWT